MKTIDVTDEVFGRLQLLAQPFVDTPSTVIARLLDVADVSAVGRASSSKNSDGKAQATATDTEPQSYTFKRPTAFVLFGERHDDVSSFKEVYLRVCAEIARRHPSEFTKAFLLRGRERAYFNATGEGMTHPQKVPGTNVYMETNFSAQNIVDRCHDVLKLFGDSSDDLSVELRSLDQ